jgi:hypothetical protein
MDLSKLPKFSESPAPPPNAPADPQRVRPQHLDYGGGEQRTFGFAEAWMSIALGVIMLILSPRLLQYLMSPTSFSQKWTFSAPDGSPLDYTKTVFFWGDVALVMFALVLIVEGLVLAFGRRVGPIAFALGLTVLATLINLVYVIGMIVGGYGPQIFSMLAVAFGVYITYFEWTLLKSLLAERRSSV